MDETAGAGTELTRDENEALDFRGAALAVKGGAALVFAFLTFIYPGTTVMTLVLLFAIWALVDGLFSFGAGLHHRGDRAHWGGLLFEGAVGVCAGLAAFFIPGTTFTANARTAFALKILVGIWALLTGFGELIAAGRLRRFLPNDWMLGLAGALSMILGAGLLLYSGASARVLVVSIGLYALVVGVLMLSVSTRVRGLIRRTEEPVPETGMPAHA